MSIISDRFAQLGGMGGFLGAPLTLETRVPGGIKQDYAAGSLYLRDGTETAFVVHGSIGERYRTLGAEASSLGWPITDELAADIGAGRFNHFESGSIFWLPTIGAHEVLGEVRERWIALRRESGLLGYPTGAPRNENRDGTNFTVVAFQNGTIEVNGTTNRVLVRRSPSIAAPRYTVPVVAYRAMNDDGSRPAPITADGVRMQVAAANLIYSAAGVVFTYDGVLTDLREGLINRGSPVGSPDADRFRDRLNGIARDRRSILVVYYFGEGNKPAGGGSSAPNIDYVMMGFFDPAALAVLPHEFGHLLGLPHTHGVEFKTLRQAKNYVLSGGSLADIDYDSTRGVNDTPGDPFIEELKGRPEIEAVELGGLAFALPRKNIMSYWPHEDSAELSHSQIDRVREAIDARRARYLNVTNDGGIDCVPLLARLDAEQQQLADLRAEADAEPDPRRRRIYFPRIAALVDTIGNTTKIARSAGCIR